MFSDRRGTVLLHLVDDLCRLPKSKVELFLFDDVAHGSHHIHLLQDGQESLPRDIIGGFQPGFHYLHTLGIITDWALTKISYSCFDG